MTSAAVLIEDGGICPLFFVLAVENLTAQVLSPPGICHVRPKKKMLIILKGAWVHLELIDS